MPDNKQEKPKSGGLFYNNKTAFIDSTLNAPANKNKEWVQRLYKKNTPKITLPGEDRPSTHLMGDDGNGYVFPTLVVPKGQTKLSNMGNNAEDYARATNTGIQFKKKVQGDYFASHKNSEGSYGGYKKGTGVLSEFSKGVKSMKTYKSKYKKAASGLQSVAVPEQGDNSNVLSSATTMASAGAQLGPWGAAAGGILGLASGLFQKSAQDKANKQAIDRNKVLASNRAVDGVDESINQKTQVFKKGGKPTTKMIEIEGKKTPEIHTDKNFNIKNLGTTPHSKGGNKVEASEGDIVFNTQNSLAKYNKIANAIQNKDHDTLKVEQGKLPDDTSTKMQQGVKGTKKEPDYMMEEQAREAKGLLAPNYMKSEPSKVKTKVSLITIARNKKLSEEAAKQKEAAQTQKTAERDAKHPGIAALNKIPGAFSIKNKAEREVGLRMNAEKKTSSTNTTTAQMRNTNDFAKPFNFNNPLAIKGVPKSTMSAAPISKSVTNPIGSQGKRTYSKTTPVSTNKPKPILDTSFLRPPVNTGDGTDFSKVVAPFTGKVDMSKTGSAIASTAGPTNPTAPNTPTSNTANNIAQFAGVANNIYQGMKEEKPVNQQYFDPQLNKYVDRSESLRQQSTSAQAIQDANSRNASGGNASNIRANANQSAIANLGRQDSINEREMGRADQVAEQNVGIKNQAGQVNLQRKDMYQQQIDGTRAAKQSYLDQATQDISKYGQLKTQESYMRSRDDKALQGQLAGAEATKTAGYSRDTLTGKQIYDPTGANYSGGILGGRNRPRRTGYTQDDVDLDSYDKPAKKAKGVKAVKTSKYKMK